MSHTSNPTLVPTTMSPRPTTEGSPMVEPFDPPSSVDDSTSVRREEGPRPTRMPPSGLGFSQHHHDQDGTEDPMSAFAAPTMSLLSLMSNAWTQGDVARQNQGALAGQGGQWNHDHGTLQDSLAQALLIVEDLDLEDF